MRKGIAASLLLLIIVFTPAEFSNACTNFCMDTPAGPVFGCNLDLFIPGDGMVFINRRGIKKSGFGEGTTGIKAEWISKYGSVTFNLAGLEWAFGGMNEEGLVIGSMELLGSRFSERDERPPLPIGPWAQYILDNCKNIDEVVEAEKKVRLEDSANPVHFLISDATGASVVIEWYKGITVIRKGEELPVKALSNSFYDVALESCKKGGPSWWESDRGDTNQRFTDAAERNKNYASSGEKNALKYAFETLTNVVAAPHTKWNIVYNIPERQILYRSAASPALKYLYFKDFDFSCDAPLLTLDVNAYVEGDVAKHFTPYDPEKNRVLFTNLCRRLGVKVSDNDIRGLIEHLEQFDCAGDKK